MLAALIPWLWDNINWLWLWDTIAWWEIVVLVFLLFFMFAAFASAASAADASFVNLLASRVQQLEEKIRRDGKAY